MNMVIGWLMAASLAGCVFTIHHFSIRWLRCRLRNRGPNDMLIAVTALFATHLIESGLFALGLLVSAEYFEIGALVGDVSGQLREYLYYSMVTYTSLGLGDVFPLGELRLISGIEVLTGLLVIGWSASFLFSEMSTDRTARQAWT